MLRVALVVGLAGCWTSSSPPPTEPKPVPKDVVQPVKLEARDVVHDDCPEGGCDSDPCTGVVGGTVGGVVGGVVGGPPPPPPPPPPTMPQTVPPTMLESYRIAGNKLILPDDKTKLAITRAGMDRVIASLKVCLDVAGAVSAVKLLKSSGFPAYDRKLEAEINLWRYRPFQINGQAAPVCTAVTFIYKQDAPDPPLAPGP